MKQYMDSLFQNVLMSSRWLILVVVVSGLLSTVIMITLGTVEVLRSLYETIHLISTEGADVSDSGKLIMSDVIGSVDAYLIATVLLLFSIGLYELFIGKIKALEEGNVASQTLVIKSLDQLKEKLGKVIIMILIVSFFQRAINIQYGSALDLLYIGVSILFVAVAVFITHKKGKLPTLESSQ